MKQPYPSLRLAAGVATCAILSFIFPPAARAAENHPLSTHVPASVVAGLKPTGNLPDTQRLHLAIGLPSSDQAGLDKFLKELYDPASPNYRHYLSVAQFADKFGASQADYEAVRAFARTGGLVESQTYPNRILLSVEASVADIRRVFHVNIRTYQHPTEDRQFYAPDAEPTLDLAVPVLHIAGLDNYVLPHPINYKMPTHIGRGHPSGGGSTNAPFNGSGPGGSYLSQDFRNAYAPGVTLNGSGQNAALFEFDGYFTSDITSYEQITGLPNVHLVNIPIDGGVGTPGGASIEVSLDIEMIMAMAPSISTIYVYESPGGPPDDMIGRITSDNFAKQISSSWGFGGDATTDQLFQELAAQGQSFFQASGDLGAFDSADGPGGFGAVSGESPYFTLVGGTELVMNGLGFSYAAESVWGTGQYQQGANWGSSGGICPSYPIPVWQQGIDMTANHGSTAFRNSPDVALTADGIWIYFYDGESGSSGGTSAAAPLWCGFNAMVNQQATLYGMPPDGFINPAIYALCKSPSYGSCFHDVVVGNNTWPGSPSNYFAVPGYDLCTGWGTPTGSNLINFLAPPLNIPVLLVVTDSVTGGNGSGVINFDECVDLTFLITNEGRVTATGIQGFLYSTTYGAIVAQSTANFPNLPPGTAAYSTTSFTLSTEPSFICGTPIDLVLILKSDQTVRTNNIQIPTGIVGPPVTFSNETPFVIPQGTGVGVVSPVTVSGLQAAAKITVSVYANTEYDEGLTLQLTSPDGTNITLVGDFNGGLGANYGSGCSSNSQTIFDDNAATSITAGTAPFIGTFQPIQPLSTLLPSYGTNLNGVWQLSASEYFINVPATLVCWSLNIEPYVCQDGGGQCPGSALSLTMTASPDPVLVFSNEVFNLMVSNGGPSSAENVVISQTLPPGFGFVMTSNYPVVVTPGTNLTLSLGALPVYGTAIVSVVTIPSLPGLATSTATVGSTAINPNPNSSTASVSTLVVLPSADLAVSMTAAPSSVLQGGLVTYTIVVTNNGPFAATGVVLTNLLPANANYISATTSQGSMVLPGVLFDLGSMPSGTNAVITVVVSPTTTGNITDTAQVAVGPSETDPVLFNNTASFTVTVGPSADLGVSAQVTPSTVVAGNNCTYVATVFNNGPSPATDVVFNQTIPGGTGLNSDTFVSSSVGGVTVANGNITWDIGSMSNGAILFITNVLKTPAIQSGGRPDLLSSVFSIFGQPGDANTNNNVVVVTNLAETPSITIVSAGATLVSQGGSFSNGAVNPGETVGVVLYLQNTGNVSTTNLQATLLSTNGVLLPTGNPQTYGILTPGAAPVGGYFTFVASGSNGGTVSATLALQDGTNNLGTNTFVFYLPSVQTFWNTNIIYIPKTNDVPQPDAGPANPYPSTIQVSNVLGYVSKVTVIISNLSHTYPHDIGMLLVGPTTNAVLMDAVGNFPTQPAQNITLVLDSTAAVALPSQGNLTSGTYQPADYNPADLFTNAVAPPGSSNALSPPYSTNLGSFNGLAANGLWALYAHDNVPGDAGTNYNGWGLTITTITPVNPTNSLVAGIVSAGSQVVLGNLVTNLFSVTNYGATTVSAFLTNILPAGLTFVSAAGSPSNYAQLQQTMIIYNLGNLGPGQGVTVTNVDRAAGNGPQTNTISAGVPFAAFDVPGNSASAVTTVTLPVANLVAAISAMPNPAIVGSNLTYTLSVTNLGPSNAVNTIGTFPLAGLSNVSVTGSFTNGNGAVACLLGTILPNNVSIVTLTATPVSIGVLTNFWSVNSSNTETGLSANSASVRVVVTNSAALIVADGATLLTPGANGSINAGVPVIVDFTLANQGTAPTAALYASLQASGGITPATNSQNYGAILPYGGTATQPFGFTANGAPGATVTATLTLTNVSASATNSLGSVSFQFQLPITTNIGSSNFASSAAIIIPQFGPGTPYPSVIQVSRLTNFLGSNLLVAKVTVTLNGFGHTFPHDVNVLLDSPSGQELIVMGHAGGAYSVSNLNLTFNDAATQSLPTNQLATGTFLPTDYPPADVFPDFLTAPTATALAAFDGINPNGVWSLYVYDDTEGNAGVITGGWSLGLTAVSTVNPAALLAASMISSPNPVLGGNFLSYQITVTNEGPGLAENVVITDTLPASVTFSSGSASQGSAPVAANGTVTFNLGSISNGTTATAIITVVAGPSSGTIVNTATVTTASSDLNLSESTAANSTTVVGSLFELQAAYTPGGLQLTVLGQSAQSYVIQTSSNLLTWASVYTNTVSFNSSSFIYTDTHTNAAGRFYRAIHPPQ